MDTRSSTFYFDDSQAGASTFHFQASFKASNVDREAGVIREVAVVTADVPAVGHKNLFTDSITLAQMLECGQRMGKVPVKWNHKTGADAVSGYLSEFRMAADGKKLVADWYLLKTHERYEHAMELAERMPESVGLSAAFKGEPAEDARRGCSYARCTQMLAVDLVAHPAANPDGLLEEGSDVDSSSVVTMSDPASPTPQASPAAPIQGITIEQLGALLDERLAPLQELDTRLAGLEEFNEQLVQEFGEPDDGEETTALSAEVAEVTPAVTAADVISEVIQHFEAADAEQAEADAMTSLESKVAAMATQLGTLQAENEALRLTAASGGGRAASATLFSQEFEDGEEVNTFEAHVSAHTKAGKSEGAAVLLARKEHPAAYETYLAEKGVLEKTA